MTSNVNQLLAPTDTPPSS